MSTNAFAFPDWYLQRARKHRLVIMAGADVSGVAPSKLPNWSQLNKMILSALGERVDSYVRSPGDIPPKFGSLIDARRNAETFPPAYHGQEVVDASAAAAL